MGPRASSNVESPRRLFPVLLIVAWIVGCAVIVYFVFA
ncbi:sarcoplasmic/endoplasmic reticulum calcium ATPase regulator DWORF-like [Esox lucius]|nr:sarcoplasmic/endoplasmic reticulum calcium ATPase regulator DWORF-like [Esox lucius]